MEAAMIQYAGRLVDGVLICLIGVASLIVPSEAFAQTNDSCTANGSYCLYVDNSGNATGGTPFGVHAVTSGGWAVYGEDGSAGSAGIGVFGQASGSGTGTVGINNNAGGVGIAGIVNSTGQYSTPSSVAYGVYGSTSVSSGYGGYFTSSGTGTAGTNAALYGNASSASGSTATGVLGTGYGYGVYGYSGGGDGVHGVSPASSNSGVAGINTSDGNGVYGSSTSGTKQSTSATAAVYAYNTNGGWAVYSNGPMNVYNSSYWYDYGTASQTCVGGLCVGSDQRLKKNIQPLQGTLNKLLQVKGVTFEWKKTPEEGPPGRQTGIIAQDVEAVFPEWVHERPDGMKLVNIDSRTVLGVTVEAFRDQQAEIDALKEEVKDLKDARRPVISLNPSWGMGVMGIAIGGGLFMGLRRKKDDENKS
jgi:hypothetical protein